MAITAIPGVKKVPVLKSNPVPSLPMSKLNLSAGYQGGSWNYPIPKSGGAITAVMPTNPKQPMTLMPTPQYTLPVSNSIPGSQAGLAPGNPAAASNPINYQPSIDEIEATPEYKAALSAYNSSQQANWNNLVLGLGSKIAQGGYDVSGQLQNALGSDPQYSGLSSALAPYFASAASNPTSQAGQIALAYNRGMQQLPYAVQAQGGYGQSGASGAYDAGAQGLLENQQLQTNQGQNALLQAIYGDISNNTALGSQGLYGLQQAREAAATRLSQIPGAAYGVGNYIGPDPQQPVPGTGTGAPGTGVPSMATVPLSQGGPVIWGGQPYTSVAALTKALAKTGVSYQTWAKNHQTAAQALAKLGR